MQNSIKKRFDHPCNLRQRQIMKANLGVMIPTSFQERKNLVQWAWVINTIAKPFILWRQMCVRSLVPTLTDQENHMFLRKQVQMPGYILGLRWIPSFWKFCKLHWFQRYSQNGETPPCQVILAWHWKQFNFLYIDSMLTVQSSSYN